jgi:hypothetical protein
VAAVENRAVDLREDEEGGNKTNCENRGCAWLRMNAKSNVERREIEGKIKIHNFSFMYKTNAEEYCSSRCSKLLFYREFQHLKIWLKLKKNIDIETEQLYV